MYTHNDSADEVMNAFFNGLETFMYQAGFTTITQESNKMLCPSRKCNYIKFARSENVWKHLVNIGFASQYYIWFQYGEGYGGKKLVVVIVVFRMHVIMKNQII